jgi:hypothetical protein
MGTFASVDCEAGRRLGCRTFCCRLLVRLQPDERRKQGGNQPAKGFVDKETDGLCVHLDRVSFRCCIWNERPRVCRGYDCNDDFLLQVALRGEFRNIADLLRAASRAYVPRESFVRVPSASDAPEEEVRGAPDGVDEIRRRSD